MMISRTYLALGLACLAGAGAVDAPVQRVATHEALQAALRGARPGARILIEPGTYRGGLFAGNLKGTAAQPIEIAAADPAHPPVFRGGGVSFHLAAPAHLIIRDLIIENMDSNGLNIDDGGSLETPAHHVVLQRLVVREVGPRGNRDGIKLSGVDHLRVENCRLERWGDGGSGIDMVGCHHAEILRCSFQHADDRGDNAVQAKGGSADVLIRDCRFDHAGQRAVNVGGSTGLPYFRPRPRGYEARDVTVENCTFVGSMAAVAFAGIDGATVRRNTIYRPRRWAFRILQENREPGFVPCRNGRIEENLIVFQGRELATPVNIGDATAPATFSLARNAWYCLDLPNRSAPRFENPLREVDGIHGVEPGFVDAGQGDFRLRPGQDRLRDVGARLEPEAAR